jgi:hypothetical protein
VTIADNATRNAYVATNGQTAFTYGFEILAQTDLVVLQNGTTLTLSTHYTVSGVGDQNGGTVTLVTGATTGDEIVIYRDMALERTTDYQSGGKLNPDTLDLDLDRLLLGMQQIERDVGRALRLAPADVFSPLTDLVLPDTQARASKFLSFDTNGKPSVAAAIAVNAEELAGVESIALLEAVSVAGLADGSTIFVTSYYGDDNGGGGRFVWRATSEADANGGTVILPTGHSGAGRWVRVYSDAVNVLWFGAKGDGSTDDATAIQAAIDVSAKEVIFPFPTAHWKTASRITVGSNKHLRFLGCNMRSNLTNYIKPTSAVTNHGLYVSSVSKGVRLTNVGIDASDMPDGAEAFHQEQSWGVIVDNMVIQGIDEANKVGFSVASGATTGNFWNIYDGIFVDGSAGTGIKYLGTSANRVTSTAMRKGEVIGCTTGYSLTYTGSGILFDNCGAENCLGDGVYLDNTSSSAGAQVKWRGGEVVGCDGWGFSGSATGRVLIDGTEMSSNTSGDINHATLALSQRFDGGTMHAAPGNNWELRQAVSVAQEFGGYRWRDANAAYGRLVYIANNVTGGAQDGHLRMYRQNTGADVLQAEFRRYIRVEHSLSVANSATTVLTIPIPTNKGIRVKAHAEGIQTGAGTFSCRRDCVAINNTGTVTATSETEVEITAGGAAPAFTFTPSTANLLVQFNHGSATPSTINFVIEIDGPVASYTKA